MAGSEAWPTVPQGNRDHTEAAVVIIGGGISGMCTAIDLIQRNKCKNFVILERSGGIGGTWRDNKYPGCCCDVWSHLYSYSFEQNPDWTREYPGQEEILRYLVGVAQKYELYRYVRFNSTVESAKWDDATKKWHVDVRVEGSKDSEFGSQYTLKSDFLVSAVGQLNQPKAPSIEGIETFRGKLMHSARWDWSYDLRGKKVAIIGNGATAAQIIPEIVKEVDHLTIHQRTPNWVIPRLDEPIPEWKRSMYRYLPYVRHRKRADMMDFREAFYNAVFDNNHPVAQFLEGQAKDHMRAQLPDRPDLWEKLQPKYKIGCKRVIISDDYLPVFSRDNVKLKTYNEEIQRELQQSSFNDPGCGSWYKREDNGKITQNWSRTVVDYQKILSNIDWNEYEVSGAGADRLQEGYVTKIGRVVEESLVSYQTMGLTALGIAAAGAAVALRSGVRLRLR